MYQRSLEGKSVGEEVEEVAKAQAQKIKNVVEDPKGAIKNAEKS